MGYKVTKITKWNDRQDHGRGRRLRLDLEELVSTEDCDEAAEAAARCDEAAARLEDLTFEDSVSTDDGKGATTAVARFEDLSFDDFSSLDEPADLKDALTFKFDGALLEATTAFEVATAAIAAAAAAAAAVAAAAAFEAPGALAAAAAL